MSKLLKLARSGDSDAIASLLGEKLESHGIWVMGQRRDEVLDLIVESLSGPNQGEIAPFVAKAMTSLRPVGLRTVILRGRRMGESSDTWQHTLALAYIPPAEPPKPEPDSSVALPLPTPPPIPAETQPSAAQLAAQLAAQSAAQSAAPNALIDAAQQGQGGAISGLFAHEFRRDNVVVRTVVGDRLLTVRLSTNKLPDQVTLTRRVITMAQRLELPFMETLRIEGYQRGQPEPVWTAEYEGAALAEAARSHQVRSLDPDGRTCMISGLVTALILTLIPLTRAILGAWIVLVHELGHAIPSWLFGYLAIPTFDFLYGGGITLNLGRIPGWSSLLLAGLAYLCYLYRQNGPTQRLCIGFMALYSLARITPIHEVIITAMGHGGELVAIALCVYFVLGRYFCARPGERFLLALLGWFTLLNLWMFSGQLVFSAAMRAVYEEGKGGLLDNDLVVLADQYHLFGVVPLALLLMGLGGGAIAFAAIAFRYEQWWTAALAQRLIRNPQPR